MVGYRAAHCPPVCFGEIDSLFVALLLAGGAQLQKRKSLNLAAIALYGPVNLKSSPSRVASCPSQRDSVGRGRAKRNDEERRRRERLVVGVGERAEAIPKNMGFRFDSELILYSKESILFTILLPKLVILNRFRIVGNRNQLSLRQNV